MKKETDMPPSTEETASIAESAEEISDNREQGGEPPAGGGPAVIDDSAADDISEVRDDSDADDETISRRRKVVGIALIGLALVFLADQFSDMSAYLRLWPLVRVVTLRPGCATIADDRRTGYRTFRGGDSAPRCRGARPERTRNRLTIHGHRGVSVPPHPSHIRVHRKSRVPSQDYAERQSGLASDRPGRTPRRFTVPQSLTRRTVEHRHEPRCGRCKVGP